MRRWLSGLSCLVALTGVPQVAAAAPAHGRSALLSPPRFPMGRSVGSPTDGHLVGGSHLDDSPYIRSLAMYAGTDDRWGLGSLVAMIDRSARAVRRQYPDAVLSVGHLSQRGGGDIERHASHESGRDADLAFYVRGQTHHPLYSDHMVSFRGDGTAPSWPGAFFDDAKNWALVSAISRETHARVTYIFVASPLRARLLAYAARIGAPLAVRNRAAELMVQPRGSLPHDDHFHVRIACPPGMESCIELPTRPKASRSEVAQAAHRAGPVATRARATTEAHRADAKAAHPVSPAPSAPDAPEPDNSPTVTSAVIAVPFDDVDGPADPPAGPRHREIQ